MSRNFIAKKGIIESKIYLIRGLKVMVDEDLAMLYQVSTKRLNEQVRRNLKRFPKDFMFQLTRKEFANLRSHFATSSYGGRRYLPNVFTEQGVAMLSSILNSERAIQVNIQIMRAFIRFKNIISANKQLSKKLEELEGKLNKHDLEIQSIFEAIRKLTNLTEGPKRKVGFSVN